MNAISKNIKSICEWKLIQQLLLHLRCRFFFSFSFFCVVLWSVGLYRAVTAYAVRPVICQMRQLVRHECIGMTPDSFVHALRALPFCDGMESSLCSRNIKIKWRLTCSFGQHTQRDGKERGKRKSHKHKWAEGGYYVTKLVWPAVVGHDSLASL